MLKKIIKKIMMHGSAKFYSLKYQIGKKCQFQNISILGARNSIFIGDKTYIFRKTELCGHTDNPVVIRDNTFINQRCIVRPGTTIGNRVSIGPNTMLMTDTHEMGDENERAGKPIIKPIVVGDGCWIGANVTILGGVTIGKGAVIGAGSLVNKNCEPNALYGGTPAKLIKYLD